MLIQLLLSAAFIAAVAAQVTCGALGYDLSSLAGTDLSYTGMNGGTTYTYWIRPCGIVNQTGYCLDQPGQFCQGNSTISTWNYTSVSSIHNSIGGIGNGPLWAQVTTNGQSGVAQMLQDGSMCDTITADNQGTIEFLCNATATTAFISSIIETTTCHFQAIIQTSLVCPTAALGISKAPGSAIISSECGGGIYDISSLSAQDLQFNNISTYNWTISICGTVTSINLCNSTINTSICQVQAGQGYTLATYTPSIVPVVWQYNAPGSLSQIIQDGAGCDGQNRFTNVTMLCNTTATTPFMVSPVVENPQCHYTITLQTNAVCGTAFAVAPPAPVSSSAAAFPAPSSSAAAASSSAVVASSSGVAPSSSAVALSSSAAAAQVTCGALGYDLSSLAGTDLSYTGMNGGTTYTYWIRPCGIVNQTGYCLDQPGQFCQGNSTISTWNYTSVSSIHNSIGGIGNGPLWAQVTTNGQSGVAQMLQDGSMCDTITADNQGTIEFLCNATATTAFISSIIETTTCHFQAIIQTSLVCPTAALGISKAPGSAIISSECGGGIYDISSLSAQDLQFNNISTYNWTISICGTVTSINLCNSTINTSICQVQAGQGYTLATYTPSIVPVVWQYNAPGSLSQIIQDGAGCDGQNRFTNVTMLCNTTATTPFMVSPVVENPQCHYTITLQTNAVCGTAFAVAPPAPVSSSAAAFPAPSSSAAAASSSAVVASSSGVAPSSSAVALSSSAAAAQVTCGALGYDLSSLAGTDLSYTGMNGGRLRILTGFVLAESLIRQDIAWISQDNSAKETRLFRHGITLLYQAFTTALVASAMARCGLK